MGLKEVPRCGENIWPVNQFGKDVLVAGVIVKEHGEMHMGKENK